MFCRNCGKELTGTPEICTNCGPTPMAGTSFCPGCGVPTTPLTETCINCGARVAGAVKERTWKPTAAGILCIIAGAVGVITLIAVAILFGSISFVICAPLIIFGMIPIVGGIYALRRRIWGLALAGSICCALVGFVILGFLVLFASIAMFSDQPDIAPFGATIPEIIAIIWPIWKGPFIGFIVGFVIFGILPIIFVIRGKREFK